jgi:hypothetical protein
VGTIDDYMLDPKKRGKLMFTLQRATHSEFKIDDWKEFGYESGQHDYIHRHDRLLRSLYFGDDDYRDCVFQALELFANTDPALIELLINHPSEDLLGEPEAYLAANATRTIFNYIQAKVGH